MLSIPFGRTRFCDGVSRRNFMKVGALSFGAMNLTLADVFRAEAAAKQHDPFARTRHKAVINIFLGGGPPHQDMWDIKTEAPAEVRGEFKPIATNVTGIQIGETFSRIAKMADKFAFIRSVVGARGGHDAYQCTTGWPQQSLASMGGRPSLGSTVTKLQGNVDPSVPPFIGLAEKTQHVPWSDAGQTGFLGSTFGPFKPSGPDMVNMTVNTANRDNLPDRKKLLGHFDDMKRAADYAGALQGADAATERAFDVLTSSKLVEALDLSKESPKVRARYGDGKPYKYQYDGAPTANEHLLMARRLVEAGARVVTLSYGRWDSHGQNFDLVRDHGGKLDQCLTALVEDLDARGMLDDVTVIAWGEFGRTPTINKDAGRDHWPQVSCAILAGGGMKTGQVIGSTDRTGSNAKERPVGFGDIFATLYHNLGLNSETTTILDPTGRPQHLAEGKALPELV
ncbi:hypothetical protein GobsT_29810 [Gemmata obscuriglobus]|uniref:DUF1501 domain-containing protein n=1 Tax=Gemmata obscuriglobus TaxID=114 RepID=A0A2Z3H3B2_9BACT|nr:DUF1501 domain-containing protein [Gemmata obscuriglobus]AWM38812.1 DUF1501 domain-containing protein [Gemmata obscuriglobus]QEG28205.1 hypothetical protein GobsT_29810 [Gemmata obscuriglobus]VTS05946.1 hypothetical protein : Uncharacterized protein OS=Isosphaera pallida (strain ATCC 43644 / DSM 9630 / IS1B) GN=Isop_1706 PE=4 SV=1: DUF1501 [Gemmata obscuriglobus UQM 2246]